MLVLIAYLAVAITAFNRKPADQTCRDMELVIKDTAYAGFITKEELKGILQHKGIYPIGKKMERISTKSLERELSKHPLIDEAECYKTPSGKVCVEVTQRIPILRVMSSNGQNYYLDNKGTGTRHRQTETGSYAIFAGCVFTANLIIRSRIISSQTIFDVG